MGQKHKFGARSRAALATCHPALQAVAARALELSPVDFTVTEGTGLSLAIAPYPASTDPALYFSVSAAFRQAAQALGLVLRWSGDFRFFADLCRVEIDEPADGQRLASSPAAALGPVGVHPATLSELKTLTPALVVEYSHMLRDATIRPERMAEVMVLARKMADGDHWPRYEAVAYIIGCPPHLVALIHAMESGLSFSRHLHNGDPLTARTVQVPKNRPVSGHPPFSWEESAVDALDLHDLDGWDDWSRPGLAYVLERYNGWGYRRFHPDVPSPYLWSFTTVYTAGKYVADGHFDPQAVSKQAGAMALLLGLEQAGKPCGGAL
ncbi:hypothetical protein [Solidesulfovibrio sp.]